MSDLAPEWLLDNLTPEGEEGVLIDAEFARGFPSEFDRRWAAELRAGGWSVDRVSWLFRYLGADCTRGTIVAWELGWEVE